MANDKIANKMKVKVDKTRIVFVCTGNTCRSPMAELLLKSYLKKQKINEKYIVTSAGIHAAEGEEISRNSLLALRELGVKATKHKAKKLTVKSIEKADLVVCMTIGHKNAIKGCDYVYTVSEITGGQEVGDPYGQSVEVYLSTANYLNYACEDIVNFANKLKPEKIK